MIAALEPLHEELERVSSYLGVPLNWLLTHGLQGPQTARETSFIQAFGRELHEAREATRRYQKYGEIKDLDNAWDIYFAVRKFDIHCHVIINVHDPLKVFKKVEKQLPQLTTLDLQYVSPELLKARNLELAVPGKYPQEIDGRRAKSRFQGRTRAERKPSGLQISPLNCQLSYRNNDPVASTSKAAMGRSINTS